MVPNEAKSWPDRPDGRLDKLYESDPLSRCIEEPAVALVGLSREGSHFMDFLTAGRETRYHHGDKRALDDSELANRTNCLRTEIQNICDMIQSSFEEPSQIQLRAVLEEAVNFGYFVATVEDEFTKRFSEHENMQNGMVKDLGKQEVKKSLMIMRYYCAVVVPVYKMLLAGLTHAGEVDELRSQVADSIRAPEIQTSRGDVDAFLSNPDNRFPLNLVSDFIYTIRSLGLFGTGLHDFFLPTPYRAQQMPSQKIFFELTQALYYLLNTFFIEQPGFPTEERQNYYTTLRSRNAKGVHPTNFMTRIVDLLGCEYIDVTPYIDSITSMKERGLLSHVGKAYGGVDPIGLTGHTFKELSRHSPALTGVVARVISPLIKRNGRYHSGALTVLLGDE